MVRLQYCVIGALLSFNEAFTLEEGMVTKVATKAEIMAQMTTEKAVETLMRIKSIHKTPELMATIENHFGVPSHARKPSSSMSNLQTALRGGSHREPTGYAAVGTATKMLNDMTKAAFEGLEAETERCQYEDGKQSSTLNILQTSVRTFNGQAAGARGGVVSAQGEISTLEVNVVTTTEAFEEHKITCATELRKLRFELTTVEADILVMGRVLDLIDCPEQPQQFMLVQCDHCNGVMLRQAGVQQALGGLQSEAAKQFVKDSLDQAYEDAAEDAQDVPDEDDPPALAQMSASHRNFTNFTNVTLNISEEPVPPEVADCVETDKCSIAASPNCQKLKDRFIVVQAGISDKKVELDVAIREKEEYCTGQTQEYETNINDMQAKLRQERAKLAVATEEQNQAETGSHVSSQQHASASTEYTRTMKACCDNKNTFTSEMCALEKIRGELNNMNGTKVFITDCEVSDWREEECSSPCNGGTAKSVRSIITHKVGQGVDCPALEKVTSCHTEVCPVDCLLGSWGEWSECGAACGGGVKERSRDVETSPAHGGEPCASTQDLIGCNVQACNKDCTLSKWSGWTTCSRTCDGGTKRRVRAIKEPKVGGGNCWNANRPKRLQFKKCNKKSCKSLLRKKKKTLLQCRSQVDVTVLLDGSASLGWYGWTKSKQIAEKLVKNLNSDANAQVSLELFSGPSTWSDYQACTNNPDNVDMEKQCRIFQVSPYTSDTDALAEKIRALKWPARSTLTSVALGMADADLKYGREGAASVVVVLTDGKPISYEQTKAAALRLQQHAKVVWIPIGRNAPIDLIKELASEPQNEHVIEVNNFYMLRYARKFNELINNITTTICPEVA